MSQKMKKILLLLPALLWAAMVFSQNTFNAILRNKETAEALPGVTAVIKGTTLGGVSDEEGTLIIENIPDGQQTIIFTGVGFHLTVTTPWRYCWTVPARNWARS